MRYLRLALNLLMWMLDSVAIAWGALLVWTCVWAWIHGGSPDPRCVMGWHGYAEEREYTNTGTRVSCVYRP